MSYQGEEDILINHRVIKQVVDQFIAPALLAGFKTRSGAKWKPRLLAAVALLWAVSSAQNLTVLRLIVIEDGKHPMYLITDLSKSQLSDRQAATIYGARWGIELFFRTFKQTFGRRKLRSRSEKNAKFELDWSLLALWCMCLLGQHELSAAGRDPTILSPAATIEAFQDTLTHYRVRPESIGETLRARLRNAYLDDYQRTGAKTSRSYPRKKKREHIGAPQITNATKQQIATATKLKSQRHEFRLTA